MNSRKQRNRCEACNELLHPDREVWLELNSSKNTWHDPNKDPVSEKESQGCFPFGKACAKNALLKDLKVKFIAHGLTQDEMMKIMFGDDQ